MEKNGGLRKVEAVFLQKQKFVHHFPKTTLDNGYVKQIVNILRFHINIMLVENSVESVEKPWDKRKNGMESNDRPVFGVTYNGCQKIKHVPFGLSEVNVKDTGKMQERRHP